MRTTVLMLLTGVLLAVPAFGADKTGAAAAQANPNPTLTQMLTYALQDEWAARAEYRMILKQWPDQKPFANVVQAEESHIGWLLPLFQAHDAPVPVEPRLNLTVPADWTKALAAGAEAEVLNIAMYDSFLKRDLPADVRTVFEELKRGSENHLRAFQGGGGKH